MNDQYELTEWQRRTHEIISELKLGTPPEPWNTHHSIGAAGVFGGGWTEQENFILLSFDGYSIVNPRSGAVIQFNRNTDDLYSRLDAHETKFKLEGEPELINIFGLKSGDGIHMISDWKLDTVYPYWPNTTVILYKSTIQDIDNLYGIDTGVCDPGNWIKCGFSPSGKIFTIVGHGGAEFYSRQ